MNVIEKIKLQKALASAVKARNHAANALAKIKATNEIKKLRQQLGMYVRNAETTEVAMQEPSPFVVPENATRKELGQAVEEWLKANVQGKIITASDGKKIRFNRAQSVKHLVHDGRLGSLEMKTVAKIVEIFTTGEAKGRELANKVRQDDFVAFHRYDKWLEIDGWRIHAVAKAGERADGTLESLPDLIAYSADIYQRTVMDSLVKLPKQPRLKGSLTSLSNNGSTDYIATLDSAQDEPLATLTILEITDLAGNPISLDELDAPTEAENITKAQRATYYAFDENRTKAQRQRDNNAVFALLDRLDSGELLPENLTEADRQILAKYSGNGGGLKGRDGKIGSAHE